MPRFSSEKDLFESSQESLHSQESPRHVGFEGEVDLPMILSELRKMQSQIDSLEASNKAVLALLQNEGGKKTSIPLDVTSSTMKKPFLSYLKGRFFSSIWINEDDSELKMKAKQLLQEAGHALDGHNLVKCYQFASHQFTNWRNQLRLKLVSTDKNVRGKDLKELSNFLFGSFKSDAPTEGKAKNSNLVLAMRAFMEANQWSIQFDLWKEFRQQVDRVRDRDSDYWKKLTEKQQKKLMNIIKIEND